MAQQKPAPELVRTTFAILVIGLLILSTFWVMHPFLPALVWAVMIVIASWPIMKGIQRRLWGKRWLAVVAMTAILLLVLILPLSIALSTLVNNIGEISEFAKTMVAEGIPQPPSWLSKIPVVGARLVSTWQEAAMGGKEEIITKLAPYLGGVLGWLIAQIGGFGMLFIHFLLTVIISAILYGKGEVAARGAIKFAKRLAEKHGEQALILASQAIRAVALGVVVTALIQSIMAAIGFLVAGIPYAMILTSIVFLLAVIQIGAGPVLIISIIWLYSNSSAFVATAFLIWSILIMLADNFIRPLLIKAGADLPLLLIFAGIIGGLISFGVLGLFIGPVVLAVSFTLTKAWVERKEIPA